MIFLCIVDFPLSIVGQTKERERCSGNICGEKEERHHSSQKGRFCSMNPRKCVKRPAHEILDTIQNEPNNAERPV
jgi:hypothetical protein